MVALLLEESPSPAVALACGSRSISSVSTPRAASSAPRLMAVVVLPTPPFWFAMAMTRVIATSRVPGPRGERRLRAGRQFLADLPLELRAPRPPRQIARRLAYRRSL